MSVTDSKQISITPKIGVGVLVWKNKKLLLGKRVNKDKSTCWQFPGGHLENNESIIECAHREVLEETSLHINQLRHLGFTDKPFEINQQQYITLLVSSDYQSGEAQVLEPEKCEIWQWFDYMDLPSPLFLPITLFLAQHGVMQHTIDKNNSPVSTVNSSDLYALHCNAEVVQSDERK